MLINARVVDFDILLERDHTDLERALGLLAFATLSVEERRETLMAARFGFAAHAEAEANVLYRALVHVPPTHSVSRQIANVLAAHHAQELLLTRLGRAQPGSLEWVRVLRVLRSNLAAHSFHERATVLPSVREQVGSDTYDRMASSYATERLRALSMLSAVVAKPRSRRGTAQA